MSTNDLGAPDKMPYMWWWWWWIDIIIKHIAWMIVNVHLIVIILSKYDIFKPKIQCNREVSLLLHHQTAAGHSQLALLLVVSVHICQKISFFYANNSNVVLHEVHPVGGSGVRSVLQVQGVGHSTRCVCSSVSRQGLNKHHKPTPS